MYGVLDKDMMKFEILPPFVCGKAGLCLKKVTWWELFQYILYKLKASLQWHIVRKK